MKKETTYFYNAGIPYGWLQLTLGEAGLVVAAVFVDQPEEERSIPSKIKRALDAYYKKGTALPQTLYQFPTEGTEFMQSIWHAIAAVPLGETITYTELAIAAGRPAAARAAGTACGKNPLALFIPCHRVVRSSGEDFGYSWGTDRKRFLLTHEGVTF